MKIKKNVSIDTKLASKGIRYDPNFVVTAADFKDLTNRDVRLKDWKNAHGSPSRITRSQAFQCWFYECCSYANDDLADRVGDGVPRILNWFVKYRPTYKEVKSAFFYIRQEQVVLRNITPTVLEKTILQLPDFKPVDVVVHSVDLPSTSKQECSQSSSDNELALLRSDVKMVGTSIGDNDGDNSNEKDDETPNVGGIGDDQVNDPPNVGQENDVVPEVDHISDNLMDDVGKTIDCVGGDVFGHLVDDVGEKVNFVGDCVVGHVVVDSAAEMFKDGAWENFSNFNFLKFTQNSVLSQNELDWSEIPDADISKFTQPDKSVARTDATDLVCDNVRKVDATASDNVKGIEENMVVASVMLDETPAIPRRLRKPAANGLYTYPLYTFDVDQRDLHEGIYSKVEGQSSKRVDNSQPSNRVLSIKHPFVKSITERIDDMKVTLQFNSPVYSDSINSVPKYFDYGVDTVKMKQWFFTLVYPGVPLTDSTLYKRFVENNRDVILITQEYQIVEYMLVFFMRCNIPWNNIDNVLFPINLAEEFHWILKSVAAYLELIPHFLSCIEFWKSRSDGLSIADSFDIRIYDGLPTQANTDGGVFIAAFAEYLLDGLEISNHLDDIDAIRIRYGVLFIILADISGRMCQTVSSGSGITERSFAFKKFSLV
ncbi:hypothetical protein FXO38_25762 [Capsicum annuum]|nr:hypothetical protein FXO38_25762 [Capsicum annuum]